MMVALNQFFSLAVNQLTVLKKVKKNSQESARTSERLRSVQALMKAVDFHGESQANITMGGPKLMMVPS